MVFLFCRVNTKKKGTSWEIPNIIKKKGKYIKL
jgi:hypothetical protein